MFEGNLIITIEQNEDSYKILCLEIVSLMLL